MDSTAQAASIALNKKLEQLSHENAESTIYRVHRELRSVNPKAYEPEVIAIGPYHRDKPHLKMMEDHKLRNLQSLIKLRRCNVETCAAAVGRLESEARKCYADQRIGLNSSEFVEMLLLDGCFVVELVQKFDGEFSSEEEDSIFQMRWMIVSLQRDLTLFENQLPFFVLSKLFDLVKHPNQDSINCSVGISPIPLGISSSFKHSNINRRRSLGKLVSSALQRFRCGDERCSNCSERN